MSIFNFAPITLQISERKKSAPRKRSMPPIFASGRSEKNTTIQFGFGGWVTLSSSRGIDAIGSEDSFAGRFASLFAVAMIVSSWLELVAGTYDSFSNSGESDNLSGLSQEVCGSSWTSVPFQRFWQASSILDREKITPLTIHRKTTANIHPHEKRFSAPLSYVLENISETR